MLHSSHLLDILAELFGDATVSLKIDIHHHVTFDTAAITEIRQTLHTLVRKVDVMTVHTEALTAEVAELKTIGQSAIAALNGIPQIVADAVTKALADAGANEAETQAAVDTATADATTVVEGLKAALVTNTPPADQAATQPSA